MRETEKTLRDEFAMAALTAIGQSYGAGNRNSREVCAVSAYDLADCMLLARDGTLQKERKENEKKKNELKNKKDLEDSLLEDKQRELMKKIFNLNRKALRR